MTRLRVTLCLLVLSVWLAVQNPARAYEEQASVDAFLKAVTDTANQPMYIHCGSANRVAE